MNKRLKQIAMELQSMADIRARQLSYGCETRDRFYDDLAEFAKLVVEELEKCT